MPPARRGGAHDSATRTALLDATEALMLEEGYAAVSSRRVAAKAGTNAALVYYYFGTMDDLFIALFRRGAERSLARLEVALASPQPLWGIWELSHDYSSTALTMEFIAVANHRKAIRAEIADYSRRFRRLQLDALSSVLTSYGVDPQDWPAVSVTVVLASISRFLHMEEEFGLDVGHAETVALVERHIRALEGDRLPTALDNVHMSLAQTRSL